MSQPSNQQWFIPRRRSTSDQANHYVINITTPHSDPYNNSNINTVIGNHDNRSLTHLPSNTTFIIHSDVGTDFTLIPANSNTALNRLYSELLPPLHTCESINIGALSTNRRRPHFSRLFRSKSTVLTFDASYQTRNENLLNQINVLDDQQRQSNVLNNIEQDNNNNNDNNTNMNIIQSDDGHTSNTNNNTDNRHLQRNNTLQLPNTMTPLESTTSRFSFITRHSSHRSSLRSLNQSIIRSELSRPPTYKRYDNPEQEAQQARDIDALRQLQQHYNDNTNSGLLDRFFYMNEDERPSIKKAILNTTMNQFFGFYMAFWIVVLTFLGAVSVFIPGLPPIAKLLWAPLGIYCLVGLIVMVYRYRRHKKIMKLEQQIDTARQRRMNELLSGMELPSDHYFVIERNANGHSHPVVKLIPPPPNYSSSSSSSPNGSLNLNHQNNSTVHIDLVTSSRQSLSSSSSSSSRSSPSTVMSQLPQPNLIHLSSNNNNINESSSQS